jgi:signal transduction histidine kinase/CheY-like chemotaxis protein
VSTKRFAAHTLPWVAMIGLGLVTTAALLLLVWHIALQDQEGVFAPKANSVRDPGHTSLHRDEFHHGLLLAAGIAGLMMTALCTLLVRSVVAQGQELQQRHEESEQQVAQQSVTLQEQEEALALARHQALAVVHSKAGFLADMSHELRTPLHGVLDMLSRLRHTELTPEQQAYAERSYHSTNTLLTLLSDILDLSKYEADGLSLECIDFDLLGVVEQALELRADQAYGKGLELNALLAPEVPPVVRGDPTRLRQVLTTLLGNAVRFAEQGEVVVRVALAEMQAEAVILRFCVSNTGNGLTPQAQTYVFDAFPQAEGSPTRKYGDTGLGLTTCKHLVTAMGGDLGVESTPGKGSAFWCTGCFGLAASATGAFTPLPTLRGHRVLIVTGHATTLQVIASYLAPWGIAQASATHAAEALGKLRHAAARVVPYEVAMVDEKLSDVEGLHLAQTLRAEADLAGLRVILLTGFGLCGEATALRAAGIQMTLSKPIRQVPLHDCLATVLGLMDDAADVVSGATSLAATAASPLETQTVDMLQGMLGEQFSQAVEIFLQDTCRHLEGIQEAVSQGDLAVVLHLAHTLKGSSSNLGAWRLADLCEEMVAQCRAGVLDGAAQRVAQLKAESARVQAEFGARFAVPRLASLGDTGEGGDERSTGC